MKQTGFILGIVLLLSVPGFTQSLFTDNSTNSFSIGTYINSHDDNYLGGGEFSVGVKGRLDIGMFYYRHDDGYKMGAQTEYYLLKETPENNLFSFSLGTSVYKISKKRLHFIYQYDYGNNYYFEMDTVSFTETYFKFEGAIYKRLRVSKFTNLFPSLFISYEREFDNNYGQLTVFGASINTDTKISSNNSVLLKLGYARTDKKTNIIDGKISLIFRKI